MSLIDSIRRLLDVPSKEERDAQKLNVQLDANLFSQLCLTLRAEAPSGAPMLVMEANLPPISAMLQNEARQPEQQPDPQPNAYEAEDASIAPQKQEDEYIKLCELDCRIKKSTGKNMRFTPSDEAKGQICGYLHELRNSMIRQKQPEWKGIRLTVDVPGDKYTADFRY